MKETFDLQHRLAKENIYHSVIQVLEPSKDAILVGIKNVASIPNTLMHKLEKVGFGLHTIDKKSTLAGRAVDFDLTNPITGHPMSGSSSGTALNVFVGINDLGIGNDGGGSVLAPAMCVNILGFISKLIEEDRPHGSLKPNTDGMTATSSIGFMSKEMQILYKAIAASIQIVPGKETGVVWSDCSYPGIDSKVISVPNGDGPRAELVPYLKETLAQCDVMIVTCGPVDVEGLGDSLFGHFDERTKKVQEASHKGYARIANLADATAITIPQKGLGMATLLMCESKAEKIAKLLCAAQKIPYEKDPLIERYFGDLQNYFWDGYHI